MVGQEWLERNFIKPKITVEHRRGRTLGGSEAWPSSTAPAGVCFQPLRFPFVERRAAA